MSFINELQFLLEFEDTTLLEEVTGHTAAINGDAPTIVPGVFGNALQMTRTSYVCYPESLNITTQFSIGFWLKSVNPGMVKNPTSGAMESVRIPLMAKSDFSYNSFTGATIATTPQFIIYEQTQADGRNVMSILLQGTTAATVTTAPYQTGVFNYFWITYNGTTNSLSVYLGYYSMPLTVAGVIPSSLNSTASNFSINKGVSGQSYNILNNTGVIDDLVIMNVAETSDLFVNRLITLGGRFALDNANSSTQELCQAVMFDDNTTIRINAVYSNDASIYVARSDGKLLKDNRDIWQTRRDFSDTQEVAIVQKLSQSGINVTDGVLNISGSVIRI